MNSHKTAVKSFSFENELLNVRDVNGNDFN